MLAGEAYLSMKAYMLWSLRQLYFLIFLPSALSRDVGGPWLGRAGLSPWERLRYLVRRLPPTLALVGLEIFIGDLTSEVLGFPFRLDVACGSAAWGVATGLLAGGITGPAGGLVGVLGLAPSLGVMFGVFCGGGWMASRGAGAVFLGMAGGLLGVALGIGSTAVPARVLAARFGAPVRVWAAVASVGVLASVIVACHAAMAGAVTGRALGRIALGFWPAGFAAAFLLTSLRVGLYPLDACLSTATYVAARLRPHWARGAWRWCPAVWDEVIRLPLPFVGRLLALVVRQEREYGFEQTAFIASERPLQRRAATAALAEIAMSDLHASSVAELADVTEKLEWTTRGPLELPRELTASLAQFDRATQHAGQYLGLHSAYRKDEALKLALKEVDALEKSLVATRGRYVLRLFHVANQWRGLLEGEQEILTAQVEARREVPNPFVMGDPVRETETNVFTGRRDIVRQMEESVLGTETPPTLLLHGARRVGKTSILNQLPRLLGPDFAPAALDCQNPAVTEGAGTLLGYLSRTLSDGLSRRRVPVDAPGPESFDRQPFAAMDKWLDRVERKMPEGMRALLCLDEFERLQETLSTEWGTRFLDFLRHTIQHRRRIVLLFSGSHTFEELGPIWTDRFISARRVRVSFLKREDVIPLLTEPIPEFDMTYAPGALDAIIEATSCQPYLVQAVAFELVQYLNEEQRKEATPADVEVAISRVLVSGGEYFANLWSDAGEQGQEILRVIARGVSPPDFPDTLARLREHDVLNDAGGFAVPMVERWVAEKKL